MWVDIANLIGPRGQDGQDGQKGDPGPINIGLDPESPIGWDQSGGFTFNFVDGSEQTVNLPIASAQSAGLLGAGGNLPSSGPRDITSVIAGFLKPGQTGKLLLTRSGPIVTLTFDMLEFTGDSWANIGSLPAGFRPPNQHHVTIFWGTNESLVDETSMCIIRTSGALSFRQRTGGFARSTVTFQTANTFPSSLPGAALP